MHCWRMSGLKEVQDVLQTIRKENPSYWPHGLSVGHHNAGLWLIREASTSKPVGFTGFQVFPEGLKRIGYYTVGVLPQYRQMGIAKKAVQRLCAEKANEFDEIRAYIADHNMPSRALASSLHIPVELMTSKTAGKHPMADILHEAEGAANTVAQTIASPINRPPVDRSALMMRAWLRRNPEMTAALAVSAPLLALKLRADRQEDSSRERHLDRLSVLGKTAGEKQANPFGVMSDADAPSLADRAYNATIAPTKKWWHNTGGPVWDKIWTDPRSHTYSRNARDLSLATLGGLLLTRGRMIKPWGFRKAIRGRPLGLAALGSVPAFRFMDRKLDPRKDPLQESHIVDAFTSGNPDDVSGLSNKAIQTLSRPGWQQWMVDHPVATTALAAGVPAAGYLAYRSWRRRKEQEEQRKQLMALHAAYAQNQGQGQGQMGYSMPMMTMPMMMPPMMLPMQKYSAEKRALSPKAVEAWKNLGLFTGVGTGGAALFEGMSGDPVWRHPTETNAWRAGTNVGLVGLSTILARLGVKNNMPYLTGAGITGAMGAPIKDMALAGTGAAQSHRKAMDKLPAKLLLGLLGGGALAGAGALLSRGNGVETDTGKIRVTLPTKDPDDAETQVEFPFQPKTLNLSHKVQDNLARDLRRRLRSEGRERTLTRLPRLAPASAIDI